MPMVHQSSYKKAAQLQQLPGLAHKTETGYSMLLVVVGIAMLYALIPNK